MSTAQQIRLFQSHLRSNLFHSHRYPSPYQLPSRAFTSSTKMAPIATVASLDHLVLTVKDIDATVKFYEKYCGMKHAKFSSGGVERHALSFGKQKINLHLSGKEFEPKAQSVQVGSGDLCFLIEEKVGDICKKLHDEGMEILEDGGVVDRTGAQGKIRSVYIRDPDGNLIECVIVLRYFFFTVLTNN